MAFQSILARENEVTLARENVVILARALTMYGKISSYKMEDILFQSPAGTSYSINEIVEAISIFLDEDKKSRYKLTIGTDSEVKLEKGKGVVLEFITAIVIYRNGYGGKYFWSKKRIKKTETLREKIYQEVLFSIDTAKILIETLSERLNGNSKLYDLEIHIDVGENGSTRDMISEVVGIVTGYGFTAKTKPYSYAASNVADRHM